MWPVGMMSSTSWPLSEALMTASWSGLADRSGQPASLTIVTMLFLVLRNIICLVHCSNSEPGQTNGMNRKLSWSWRILFTLLHGNKYPTQKFLIKKNWKSNNYISQHKCIFGLNFSWLLDDYVSGRFYIFGYANSQWSGLVLIWIRIFDHHRPCGSESIILVGAPRPIFFPLALLLCITIPFCKANLNFSEQQIFTC